MNKSITNVNSLALYKGKPVRVTTIGAKLEIKQVDGSVLKVREKDIMPLHLDPIDNLSSLGPLDGEIEDARELLQDNESTLKELAELAFGKFTPKTAWAAWELLSDGLHFHGEPDKIIARTKEEVENIKADRANKSAKEGAYKESIKRLKDGKWESDDRPLLEEVAQLARGERNKSRVLENIGRQSSYENAHSLLLDIGYWDETINPYPKRQGITLETPHHHELDISEESRVDLTQLNFYAIDDVGSTDPDDAIAIDGKKIWVAVADVASLVPFDSEHAIEARSRAANLYLPTGTTHMLPREITDRLGLGLQETSPALCFGFSLNDAGEVGNIEVVPANVKVTRQTYEGAEEQMGPDEFSMLKTHADTFNRKRMDNGAAILRFPEVKIRVKNGEISIKDLPRIESRDLVLEYMLMAGEAAAKFAMDNGIAFPFSTQSPPESTERPVSMSQMFAFRKQLKRSQMKSVAEPHSGLGLSAYVQCTSPLRRYLDMVAHQQLRAFLKGDDSLEPDVMLEHVGAAEAIKGAVRQAERLSNKHWTMVYLSRNPKWQGEAIVMQLRGHRGVVIIFDLGLEVIVDLPAEAEPDSIVELRLTDVDIPTLSAVFEIVH